MYRKTEAIIDLEAIRRNYAYACRLAPHSKSIAVIKADAYGHGILRVAQALRSEAPAFAVATLEEALELRDGGISQALLVLEGTHSVAACEVAARNKLSVVVHNQQQVSHVLQARLSSDVPLWLQVDTGMHRLGFDPGEVRSTLDRLRSGRRNVAVVCTHLSCADRLVCDTTQRQLERFRACVSGIDLPTSISNSAGILAWPDSHADWNRPGYMLYGHSPMNRDLESASELQPAMTLRSEIIAIREIAAGESVGYGAQWTASRRSLIGTVAIGYADGYPRHAPNGTPTRVNGRIAALVGAVSMDMIAVDLCGHDGVAIGDAVELWGQSVSVNEVAGQAGTIGYELLSRVSSRVPRIYTPQ